MKIFGLAYWAAELQRLDEEARATLAEHSPEQLAWRPGEGRWSILECFDHLAQGNSIYADAMGPEIARARSAGELSFGPFRYGVLERAFVKSLEPPVRLRMKTPDRIAPPPPSDLDPADVSARYFDSHARLRELLKASEGIDLAGARIRSPFANWMRVSIGQAFALLLAHERRHQWQAEQVALAPGFPPKLAA